MVQDKQADRQLHSSFAPKFGHLAIPTHQLTLSIIHQKVSSLIANHWYCCYTSFLKFLKIYLKYIYIYNNSQ